MIRYTATDEVRPHNDPTFGATVVDNTFDASNGTLLFDGPITKIWDMAFANCSNLTGISLPAGVMTLIENEAFYGCSSLDSISLPAEMTSIGSSAFENCSSLTSISLPAGVTSIGYSAFSGCYSLIRVDCYATTPPTLGSSAFGNIPSSAELHVRSSRVDAYSDSSWGNDYFEDRIYGDL